MRATNIMLRLFVCLLHLYFAGASIICPSETTESVKAILSQNLNSTILNDLQLSLPTNLLSPVKSVSVCLWIYPSSGDGPIFSLDALLPFRNLLQIRMDNWEIVIENGRPTTNTTITAKENEWVHYCAVIGSSNFAVSTFPNEKKQQVLKYEPMPLSLLSLVNIFSPSLGSDRLSKEKMDGAFADLKMFWSALTLEEITALTEFKDVSKSPIDILGKVTELTADLQDILSVIPIDLSRLIKPKSDTFIWLFESNVNCEEAERACATFNGRLPDSTSDTTFKDLLNDFLTCKDFDINPFWMSNSGKCEKGVYSKEKLTSISGDFKSLDTICIMNEKQPYYFHTKDQILTFHATPSNHRYKYEFKISPDEIIRYDYDTQIVSHIYKADEEVLIRETTIKKPHLLMGRKTWNEENTKEKYIFSTCNMNTFTCTNGECVEMKVVCDYSSDCYDESDEEYCEAGNEPTGYMDKRIAPQNGNNDIPVNLNLQLKRINSIDMNDNTMNLNLNLQVSWTDYRLRFKHLYLNKPININSDIAKLYWHPRIKLVTAISADENIFYLDSYPDTLSATLLGTRSKTLELINGYQAYTYSGKDVLLTHEKTNDVVFLCEMNLFLFPFDHQNCRVVMELESLVSDPLVWGVPRVVERMGQATDPVLYHNITFVERYPDVMEKNLTIDFTFYREYEAYIFIIFLPCVILVLIGLLTFIMPSDDYSDRVAVTLSSLIVMAAFFTQISSSLPSTSQPKLIDIWMFAHVFILFFVFVFNVLEIYLHNKSKEEEESKSEVPDITKSTLFKTKLSSSITPKGREGTPPLWYIDGNKNEENPPSTAYKIANQLGFWLSLVSYIIFFIGFFCVAFLWDDIKK